MRNFFKAYFKKADIILFAAILVLSLAGFVMLRKSAAPDAMIEISVSGEIVKSVPLYKDGEYRIESDYRK